MKDKKTKKQKTVDLCSIAPVLTSIEAIQPLTTEEPLCHWIESLRISNCKIYLASWKGYVEFHVASESGGNRKTQGSIFRKDVLRFVLRAYTKQNRNRWVASSVPSAMRILSLYLSHTHTHTHTHTPYTKFSQHGATLLKAGNCLSKRQIRTIDSVNLQAPIKEPRE